MPTTYDVLVVGSGATGGWAAKELCEAGMKVVMLEAGRKLDPERDFGEHTPPFDFKFRGLGNPSERQKTQPLQSGAADESNASFFVNDIENPFTTPKDRPFIWTRCRVVGGRSLTWYRHCYRYSDLDFKAASRDGFGEDWPISYQDLAPYYDKVEDFIGVSGSSENLPHLPDGKFLPPMALTPGEEYLKRAVKKMGRHLFIGRTATLTAPHRGRPACHYCGPCVRGCRTGSYYSSPASTLPVADATGNLTLITNAVVRHITHDSEGLANGAFYIDRFTKKETEVRARAVVLCGSTLESTRILLNSESSQFPTGLGNSSGVLGHYLTDHVMGLAGAGVLPELKGRKPSSQLRPNSFYIPRFKNLSQSGEAKTFIRGYGYQGIAAPTIYEHAFRIPGFGKSFKDSVSSGNENLTRMLVFGETLPRFENHVKIDAQKKDAWGIPVLHIDCKFGKNEEALYSDARQEGLAMLREAGVEVFASSETPATPGGAVHEVGTARMGNDPKKSVLNRFNQAHDVPNLFVTDGSSFVSNPCQNPTLTMMALTARACNFLSEAAKRGELKRKTKLF